MNNNTRESLNEFIDKLMVQILWIDPDPDSRPAQEFKAAAEDLKRRLDKDETILP